MISKELLARLASNDPTLKALNLSDSIETDDDIRLLVESLANNTNLESLIIRGKWKQAGQSIVSNFGAELLAQTKYIKRLDLTNNNITNKGAIALSKNKTFEHLTFNACDVGLSGLYSFLDNHNLLDLQYSQNDYCSLPNNVDVTDDTLISLFHTAKLGIPIDILKEALSGNEFSKLEVLKWLNDHTAAGVVLENAKRFFVSGNADDIKPYLFECLDKAYSKLINSQLENNKAITDEDFNKKLSTIRDTVKLEEEVICAINSSDLPSLSVLLPKLKDGVNTIIRGDVTLLDAAMDHKKDNVAIFLLGHGANIEASSHGKTILFEAAENGNLGFVRLMLMHGANITGEFDFNNETALSIAAFKMNELIAPLLSEQNILLLPLPLQEQARRHLEKWEEIRADGGPTWIAFSESTELLYSYSIKALPFLTNLSRRALLNGNEILSKANAYADIYRLLHDKIAIAKKLNPLNIEQYFSMLPGRDEYELAPLLNIRDRVPPQNEQAYKEHLNLLNRELRDHKESDIDWSKYPEFFIAQYRCIHYYENMFDKNQRIDHQKTSHLGRIGAAAAVYYMSSLSPACHQVARESELVKNAIYLRVLFQRFFETPSFTKNNKTYPSLGHYLQERMSNSYSDYQDDIRKRGNVAYEILDDLSAHGYPHFSSSDLPEHALRYGYGLKKIGKLFEQRLRPKYSKDGKPENSILGKVFIGLYTPVEMNVIRARHVAGMHNKGEINLRDAVAPERETGITGGVEAGYIFYEACLEMPNLTIWQNNLLDKYGINRTMFAELKQKLFSVQNLCTVENEIIDHIKNFQKKRLLEKAQSEAAQRGGILIYCHREREYGIEPEPIGSKNEIYEHEKDLMKTSGRKRFNSIFPESSSVMQNKHAKHDDNHDHGLKPGH